MTPATTLAEAIAMETVCMSITIDTDLCSLFRFGYNFVAKWDRRVPKAKNVAVEMSPAQFPFFRKVESDSVR
jgi:hypothetical protein